jgi:hypothetical protein
MWSVSSCAHPGGIAPRSRAGDDNTKVVAFLWPSEITRPLTPEAWRHSPWFRDEDVITPSRVVIATDRSACIMPDGDVSQPRATETYHCAGGWRYPRNRGR